MKRYGMASPAMLNNAVSGYGAHQGFAAPQQISGFTHPGIVRQQQQKRDAMIKTMYGADNRKVDMAGLSAYLNNHKGRDLSYQAAKRFGANLNQISQAGGNQGVYNLQNLQLNAAMRGYSNPMQPNQQQAQPIQQPSQPATQNQPFGILNVYAQRAQRGY